MIDWKSSYWKVAWFLLVLGLLTYLVISNWSAYLDGTSKPFEIIIFLIWIALLLAPLFREVSFFGVSLKNEIDSLRNDVEKQIVSLKSDVRNIFYLYPTMPPSDSEIPEIKSISETVLGTVRNKQREKTTAIADITVPEEISSLSHIRYVIEKELRRITKMYWLSEDLTYYPKTTIQMLDFLTKTEIIHRNLAFVIKETIAWCNSAIQDEKISEDAIKFVQEIAPAIIETLKAIPEGTKTDKEQTS